MKITCPNCTMSYQVPDDYIGTDGRSVRCANCGETWHASAAEPDQPKKAQPTPSPTPKDDVKEDASQDDIDSLFDNAPDEEQSQDDIDALFDTPSAGEDQSQDDIDALFDTPSEGEDQSQDDIDALFDTPSGGEEQSQDDVDALFDSPAGGGEEQGQEDVDALFANETADEDKGAIVPLTDEQDTEEVPTVDLMDAEIFKAQKATARGLDIETSATRKNTKKRKKGAKDSSGLTQIQREWVIGGSALAALFILALTMLLMPLQMVRIAPDLASLYESIGIDANLSGVSLEGVEVQLVQQAGAPVIHVNTELVNYSSEPVILPSIQFSVLGNEASELYSWAIGPDGVGLGPGERKAIETSVAAPTQAKQLQLRVFH